MRQKVLKTAAFIVIVFVVGGVGGVYFDQYVLPKIRSNRQLSRFWLFQKAAENVTIINKTEQIDVRGDDAVGEIASQASNTVVSIVSLGSVQPNASQASNKATKASPSLIGTGVVATSDGIVITYRSAILENAGGYKIFLYDGGSYDAQLLGVDSFTNLAYLKMQASNLTTIAFANSDDYNPGRKLIAIGGPQAQYQSRYASGLLSMKDTSFNLAGKAVALSEKYEGVFRTDFANQDEYVGGPVIGYNGQLVGVVGSSVMDNKAEYFQIPANRVKESLDLAVRGELDSRPYFGAYYVSITQEYAATHDVKVDKGALIYTGSGKQGLAILAGSPAEKAGLKINDIITAVDGQSVDLDNPLSALINRHKKGETVQLTALRDGEEVTVAVAL